MRATVLDFRVGQSTNESFHVFMVEISEHLAGWGVSRPSPCFEGTIPSSPPIHPDLDRNTLASCKFTMRYRALY